MKTNKISYIEGKDSNFKNKLYKIFEEYEDQEVLVTPEFIEELRKEAKKQKQEQQIKEQIAIMPEVELTLKSFKIEPLPEGFEVFDEED